MGAQSIPPVYTRRFTGYTCRRRCTTVGRLYPGKPRSKRIYSQDRATEAPRSRSVFCRHCPMENHEQLGLQFGDVLMNLGYEPLYTTTYGAAYVGDALDLLKHLPEESIDLVLTSPPFALQRQKEYGNVDQDEYVEWLLAFGREIKRVLRTP